MYSEEVRQLVSELPNRGELPDATHSSRAENPICGDITQFYLRIEDAIVRDCRFRTRGCPGAIAAAAALTLICAGKRASQCRNLQSRDILEYLGGLPPHKVHGADLAIDALHQALRQPCGLNPKP
ncbi:MAG: iron-sulfur cluster assembly scaffold protein [Acidobacteriota bacterium]